MKAEITISQVYYNPSVRNFFFRTQAEEEFQKLCELAKDKEELFEQIESLYDDLDEFEESLYSETTNEIIDYIGKEYFNIEEETEEE